MNHCVSGVDGTRAVVADVPCPMVPRGDLIGLGRRHRLVRDDVTSSGMAVSEDTVDALGLARAQDASERRYLPRQLRDDIFRLWFVIPSAYATKEE